MPKKYILVNENINDLFLTTQAFIEHVDNCRKDNVTHSHHEVIHSFWNTKEVITIEEAIQYYTDVLVGFDYSELYIIDVELKQVHSRIYCNLDFKTYDLVASYPFSFEEVILFFQEHKHKKEVNPDFIRIDTEHLNMESIFSFVTEALHDAYTR